MLSRHNTHNFIHKKPKNTLNPAAKHISIEKRSITLQKAQLGELFLSQTGSLMMNSCTNLLLPWSKYLSKIRFNSLKSWMINPDKLKIGSRSVQKQPFKAWFTIVNSAAFMQKSGNLSIISAIYEAETIRLGLDFIGSFVGFTKKENLSCMISHIGFIDILASILGISSDSQKYYQLCKVIASYMPNQRQKFNSKMEKLTSKNSKKISKIKRFLDLNSNSVEGLKSKLVNFYSRHAPKKKLEFLKNLTDFVCLKLELLEELISGNNNSGVKICFGTWYPQDKDFSFGTGVCFTYLFSETYRKPGASKKSAKKRLVVLARGGRFDNLLDLFSKGLTRVGGHLTAVVSPTKKPLELKGKPK